MARETAESVSDLDPPKIEQIRYRRYSCGTEIRNMDEHDLPDECPVCGASIEKLLDRTGENH